MFRVVLALFLVLSLAVEDPVRFDGDKVFRIPTPTKAELTALAIVLEQFSIECDSLWVQPQIGGFADVHINKDDIEAFLEVLTLKYEVFVEDVQVDIDLQQVAAADDYWFSAYHRLNELDSWLFDIVRQFGDVPGLNVQLTNIGRSSQNRTIYGIEFHGTGTRRVDIFWNGGMHAREWIGPATVHYLIYSLLNGYGTNAEITALVNGINFHIVPVVNSDGYEYTWTTNRMWRKTRTTYNGGRNYGVDPNRNWNYQWGGGGSSGTHSSCTYRGPRAFSEPECQATANYIRNLPNCLGYIDWHSYGQYILTPWGYTPVLPDGYDDHMRVGRAQEAAIRRVNGRSYRVGPTGNTLYPSSGSAPDYTFGNGVKYSYTIELPGNPGGFQLPPQYIVPVARESLAGALVFSRLLMDEFIASE